MRRAGRIRAALAGVALCLAVQASPPPCAGVETSAPAGAEPAPADSAAAWLPRPVEDDEEPDRLDADPLRAGGSLRLERREGRACVRRAAWSARSARRNAGVAWIARDAGPRWITGTATVASGGGFRASGAAGALVVRGAPPLLSAAMGWSWGTRRPQSPATSAPSLEPPPSQASAAVEGAGFALGARRAALWAVGGRRGADRARVGAIGIAARPGEVIAWEAAVGILAPQRGSGGAPASASARPGANRAASFSARTGRDGRALGGELLLQRSGAPAVAFEAVSARGPLGLTARWRRRAGEARPVAAEWIASARGARAAGRLTWRPWTSRAGGDDGTLEAEGSWRSPGFGPARLRIGWKRGGEDPASARERYAVLDLVVASERGRSLALLASRRERSAGGGRGTGATVGGRLTVAARRRAAGTLVVESARTGSHSAAAWTTGLGASGSSALVTRARSSVAVSARGWVRIGAARLRALWRDASGDPDAAGTPAQVTVWLEWGG